MLTTFCRILSVVASHLLLQFVLVHAATAADVVWNTNFQSAQEKAKAQKYVKQLEGLMKTYENVVAWRKQLPTATGPNRAKLLDQLIGAYRKLGNEIGALPGWRKEIVALDADNAAGLKRKYEFQVNIDDAQAALRAGHPVVAEATIDKALALPDIKPVQIQRATIVKSNCCVARKEYQASLDCLHKALEAAPKGQNADTIKDLINRSEKLLKAQKEKNGDGT